MRRLPTALAAAVLGALAGAAFLVAVVGWSPGIAFELDQEPPSFVRGIYPVERAGRDTFAWTAGNAEVTLAGLDRRVPWTCTIRFRGARGAADVQPDVFVALDGRGVATRRATNDFEDLVVDVPVTPMKPGLVLSLSVSSTFTPGPSDPRALGVQVDRIACAPASGIVLPPRRALGAMAWPAAMLGAGFALAGVTAASAIGGAALMALAQAFVMVGGGALYGAYPPQAATIAAVVACAMVVLVALAEWRRREPLRNTARFAAAFSAGALYLQMLALLHPSKGIVDAVFHVHRFDAVLGGRWYFTQLSTSATPFPYAIGLYLFAAPWAALTANHLLILRAVVSSAEIVAGLLLYPLVVRTWGSRLAAAMAVALFSLVPVSYAIIGNANMTNAFGQAVSIVTVALIGIEGDRLRRAWPFIGVAAVATLGLISHISTLVLLTATLLAIALLFWRFGGHPLRASSRAVVLVAVVGLVLGTAIYWGHFGEVYRIQFARARAAISSTAVGPAAARGTDRPVAQGPGAESPARSRPNLSLPARLGQAFEQTLFSIGWPIFLLALVGAWRWWADGGGGRLDLIVAAWLLVWSAFLLASVVSPGNRTYQQDAYEFIGRLDHATMPAAVLLAARGAAWGWRAGVAPRAVSVALLLAAVATGVRAWAAWF
jgi:hypothetical protein